jgi:hypothetical protein
MQKPNGRNWLDPGNADVNLLAENRSFSEVTESHRH